MHTDFDACVQAVRSRDSRFDGWFITAVVTTGIYCRPSCPATPPKAGNMRFYPTAAAAQAHGFRACKRCRPDVAPGSPLWDQRADVVARAMRLIADGTVDRAGVTGLAGRLGYSTRQLERLLRAEVGAGPLALARAERARTARLLIETTAMTMTDIAFAAGFASTRQFNDTVRAVFASSPTDLRRRSRHQVGTRGRVALRLPYRKPLCADSLFGHLVATAVPGVEEWRDGAYRRTLRLPNGDGIVVLRPEDDHVGCTLALGDLRDLPAAVARCRRLLDLDADPEATDDALSADPALADAVAAGPGRRIPRTVDGAELAVRIVLGQQVSARAAMTHAARLVTAHGTPLASPQGGLTHLFPEPAALVDLEPDSLGLTAARRRTLTGLVRALAAGTIEVDAGADRERARAQLRACFGLGPWSVESIAMRALGDPDAFLAGDLGVRLAARQLGLATNPAGLTARSERWRPWRSYAVQYLWSTLDHAINRLPAAS